MKFFNLFLAASFALSASLVQAHDRTEELLAPLLAKGTHEIASAQASGVAVKLHITPAAEALITNSTFDKPDPAFDRAKYTAFLLQTFTESLASFQTFWSAAGQPSPVQELLLVIDDMGEERQTTISWTGVHSRLITLDLRRWHKIYLGYGYDLGALSSIHEFTHVVNYFADEDEDKLGREFAGVYFEVLNLLKRRGVDSFLKSYLSRVAGNVKDPAEVLSTTYKSTTVLRHLVHFLVSKVQDGTYSAGADGLATLARLGGLLLVQAANADAGFDDANRIAGITRQGSVLTLGQLRQDLHATMTAGR